MGLDLSTKTGWAVLDTNGGLSGYGHLIVKDGNQYELVQDYAMISRAENIASQIEQAIQLHTPDKIIIEQTNLGKNRTSQKMLEFVHYAVLKVIQKIGYADRVIYLDTSQWRSRLKITFSKEQREHNKRVNKHLARGKITQKHLAVLYVNSKFNLSLLIGQNDIADAICLAECGLHDLSKIKQINVNLDDVFG